VAIGISYLRNNDLPENNIRRKWRENAAKI